MNDPTDARAIYAPLIHTARVSDRVDDYLAAVAKVCGRPHGPVVAIILFGSAATGGFSEVHSDVDLLLVLDDDAGSDDSRRVTATVNELETRHGFDRMRGNASSPQPNALQKFSDTVTANTRTFFLCSRADLLSGEPCRILDLPGWQALFVDRIALPGILGSARTVWGEEMLDRVALPPIRRFDVIKAFFGLFNSVLFTIAFYPFLWNPTKSAMDALKRSVHSCYVCHAGRSAPLAAEVAFLQERYGAVPALTRLLALRQEYRRSFRFTLACAAAIAWLHLRTAAALDFPRDVRLGPNVADARTLGS